MPETRRAWTPEKVDRLVNAVEEISGWSMKLAAAEERVGDILEKVLTAPQDGKEVGVE